MQITVKSGTAIAVTAQSGVTEKGAMYLIPTAGYCIIDGVDSYLVQVNNETGEVTAVEVMDKRSIHLANSIEELLCNMKGIWRIK